MKMINPSRQTTATTCLEKVYTHLVTDPYLSVSERYQTITLRRELKLAIADILKKEIDYQRLQLPKRQRCGSRKKNKKTDEACAMCERPVCGNHHTLRR